MSRADFCHVSDGECEAPAGYRTGAGTCEGDVRTRCVCFACGQHVCRACSTIRTWIINSKRKHRICRDCEESVRLGVLTFSYRGIGFSRTSKGIWVFDQIPPTGGWWARYTTPTEARILDDPRRPVNEGLAIMHLAIDRLLAGKVVYTGDIRDKHLASDPTH